MSLTCRASGLGLARGGSVWLDSASRPGTWPARCRGPRWRFSLVFMSIRVGRAQRGFVDLENRQRRKSFVGSNPTPSAFRSGISSAAEQLFRVRKPTAISLGTDLAFRGLVATAAGSSTPWRPQRAGRTKDKPATYVSVPSVWIAQVLGPALHLIPNRFFRSGSIAEFTCTRNELGSGVLMMSSNVSVYTSSSSAKPSMTWSR